MSLLKAPFTPEIYASASPETSEISGVNALSGANFGPQSKYLIQENSFGGGGGGNRLKVGFQPLIWSYLRLQVGFHGACRCMRV